jgi:integrase
MPNRTGRTSVKRGRHSKGVRLWLRRRAGRDAVWVIRDGGSEHGTGCGERDRGAAETALNAYLASAYAPPTGPATPAALAIADVLNLYLTERAPKVASPDFLVYNVAPLLRHWRLATLADIRGATCEAYLVKRLADGVKLATARHELGTLRAAIHHYHAWHGPLSAVPVVILPPLPPPRDRCLTRAEAAGLLRAALRTPKCRHLARYLLLGWYTGTRSGALLKLRWLPSLDGGHIDVDGGVIYRRPRGAADTAKRRPSVRIPEHLLPHLRRWRDHDSALGISHVMHYGGRGIASVNNSFPAIRAAAGLGADVVPHTLRHTCATWLMQQNAPYHEISGFLGMSMKMLEDVYGHHRPDHQANVTKRRTRPSLPQKLNANARAKP